MSWYLCLWVNLYMDKGFVFMLYVWVLYGFVGVYMGIMGYVFMLYVWVLYGFMGVYMGLEFILVEVFIWVYTGLGLYGFIWIWM